MCARTKKISYHCGTEKQNSCKMTIFRPLHFSNHGNYRNSGCLLPISFILCCVFYLSHSYFPVYFTYLIHTFLCILSISFILSCVFYLSHSYFPVYFTYLIDTFLCILPISFILSCVFYLFHILDSFVLWRRQFDPH